MILLSLASGPSSGLFLAGIAYVVIGQMILRELWCMQNLDSVSRFVELHAVAAKRLSAGIRPDRTLEF